MRSFWGRQREIARLDEELRRVKRSGQGRMLSVRGRRQSGKSRLLTQFVETASVPYLYFTAIKNADPQMQLAQLTADLRQSRVPLPRVDMAFAAPPSTWMDFFARLPQALNGQPAIVVLDEFPWAAETDPALEGVLQNAWDRTLEALPLLIVIVGSDLAMMQRLTEHDRPLYGRANEMVVSTLTPSEVAEAFPANRSTFDLIDVYLATGGYPRLVTAAREHRSAEEFVAAQLHDDQSPLSITGQRMLDAEFREDLGARTVLETIGSIEIGSATFSAAVANIGGDPAAAGTAVTRALPALTDGKRLVAIDSPVGAKANSRLRRYRIADPYLRFWFRYCRPHLADMARGRADLAIARFERDFASWRGTAIEPIVRDAVLRMAVDTPALKDLTQVGAWWNRRGDAEFDVVGANRSQQVVALGTIKWRTRKKVSAAEFAELTHGRAVVPNAEKARLLVICPAGVRDSVDADLVLDADAILLHAGQAG